MESSTPIIRALSSELAKLHAPVVLRYDIARVAWRLYKDQTYEGKSLGTRRSQLDLRAFLRLELQLQSTGVVSTLSGFSSNAVYAFIGATLSDRHAIVCSIDPFCYLSHLSAMEFHGLTDRLPEQIYISTPAGTAWTDFARQRMQRDLGEDFSDYLDHSLPTLRRTRMDKINQRPIHRFASVHSGAFRRIKDSQVRVSTIGRTFLDMLRNPQLCGGIAHVLEVFRDHAGFNRRAIFDELDQHGGPIDKVRAGYILEDICGIKDERIEAWSPLAARGGSRKLDPAADYEPAYSERWMLSINVPGWPE